MHDETRAAAPDTATARCEAELGPLALQSLALQGVKCDPCDAIEDFPTMKWHRVCYECGGALNGTSYMLNDRAYCSEKHRLVASRREYFASRKGSGITRSQSDEQHLRQNRQLPPAIPASPSSGLLAMYKTWM